jgi:hypothetical protein
MNSGSISTIPIELEAPKVIICGGGMRHSSDCSSTVITPIIVSGRGVSVGEGVTGSKSG